MQHINIYVYSDKKSDINATEGLKCGDSRCVGHNERLNIWHAGQHFIRLFLPLSAPETLEPHIQELLTAYAHPAAGGWDSARILGATQRLVARFVSGDYMAHPSTPGSNTNGMITLNEILYISDFFFSLNNTKIQHYLGSSMIFNASQSGPKC